VGAQKADRKTTEKGLQQHGRRSVWMLAEQRHQHIDHAEGHTQEDAKHEAIHVRPCRPPFCHLATLLATALGPSLLRPMLAYIRRRPSAALMLAALSSARTAIGIQGEILRVCSMVLFGAMRGAKTESWDFISNRWLIAEGRGWIGGCPS
jgi:hypothetical protein